MGQIDKQNCIEGTNNRHGEKILQRDSNNEIYIKIGSFDRN
jgi:hypothetical protein